MTERQPTPPIHISGAATPEDVAVVLTVLAAVTGAGGDPEPTAEPSLWAARSTWMQRPADHGPGAWRATYRR